MRPLKHPSSIQWNVDPILIALKWEEDHDAFGREETDKINLSHDIIKVVELQEGMRIAIKAIKLRGSATWLEKKRSRVKLQQEHEV